MPGTSGMMSWRLGRYCLGSNMKPSEIVRIAVSPTVRQILDKLDKDMGTIQDRRETILGTLIASADIPKGVIVSVGDDAIYVKVIQDAEE